MTLLLINTERKAKPKGIFVKTLTTTRLVLRPLTDGDFPAIAAMDADPDVMRYLAINSPVLTYEQALQNAPKILDWPCPEGGGVWTIISKNTRAFLGWVELVYLEDLSDIDFGYRLPQASWGQGIATEAGRRLADHAVRDLLMGHLAAFVHPKNLASIRVTEKIGLSRSGVLEGSDVTFNRYVLSRDDYFERFDYCSQHTVG